MTDDRDDGLEKRRRRRLEATLATRRAGRSRGKTDDVRSLREPHRAIGQAIKLSSEFIAGIVGRCWFGYVIDRLAGTSPWGLIVFLLLGFGAGVLNVLRSAGMVAEFRQGGPQRRIQSNKDRRRLRRRCQRRPIAAFGRGRSREAAVQGRSDPPVP